MSKALIEAQESPFVEKIIGPIHAENRDDAIEKLLKLI